MLLEKTRILKLVTINYIFLLEFNYKKAYDKNENKGVRGTFVFILILTIYYFSNRMD